jgi:hypothetical protein
MLVMKLPSKFIPALAALALAGAFPFSQSSTAADASGFSVEKTAHGVTVKLNGALLADYVIDQANKPYLWPVIGPTGKPMTRAYPMESVESETGKDRDHPHHRGIWFGHENIAGFDIWTDRGSWANPKKPGDELPHLARLGSIKHREFTEVKADKNSAVIEAKDDIVSPDGKTALTEEHTITFSLDGDSRIIDYDIDFIASEGPVKIGDAKDAGFNFRVPASMAVDKKLGGQIINSEGVTDAAAWGKRAKWCDYHGPVDGETLGVAMLNHPSSFRYPTPWHVRTYGLFTANPFGPHSLNKDEPDGAFTLQKGERVKLRHRIILHKGDEKSAHIAEAFEKYAAEKK